MQEALNQLLIIIAMAVGTGIAGLIAKGFFELQKWIAAKTKNQKLLTATEVLERLVQESVLMVQQTFVEQLKKDGKFDAEKQKEALTRSIKLVVDKLTPEVTNILQEVYGDVAELVTQKIEAYIYMMLPHKTKAPGTIKG